MEGIIKDAYTKGGRFGGHLRILLSTLHWLSPKKDMAVGFSQIKQSRTASKGEASVPCPNWSQESCIFTLAPSDSLELSHSDCPILKDRTISLQLLRGASKNTFLKTLQMALKN